MPRLATIASVLLLLAPWAGPAHAQMIPGVPVAFEARPLVSLPVGELAESGPGLDAGVGFGILLTTRIQVTSALGAYGGYHFGRIGCGECASVGLQDGMPEAGFEAGVQAALPFRPAGLAPWIRAGALIHRELQISGAEGGDLVSDPAVGWTAGMGARIPVGAGLQLTPGIHYRTYPAEFTVPELGFELLGDPGTFVRELDVSTVSAELGLSYGF